MIRDGKKIQETGYVTDVITDRGIEWLKGRDKSKPFLLMVQHKAPHREWEPPIRLLGHDHDRHYPEPPSLFDDYHGRGLAEHDQDMTLQKTMTRRDLKFVAPNRLTPEERKQWDAYYEPRNKAYCEAHPAGRDVVAWRYQRYMHDYLACVKAVDEGVGRVLDTLDAEGLANNTIVVYSADQGFYLGEHGWFDKRWIFEESLRTPLLVRWPGVIKPGSVNHDLVSTLDFAPTFLAAAGVATPGDVQGRDLAPVCRGQTPADWRKSFYYHYYEYPQPHHVRPHYGVVTDRYKLLHFYHDVPTGAGDWELFDREKDPLELTSVFGRPEYAETQKQLTAELSRLRVELAVPDPDPAEIVAKRARKPPGEKLGGPKVGEKKTNEKKPAEAKSGEGMPDECKPNKAHPAGKPTEAKPADASPGT